MNQTWLNFPLRLLMAFLLLALVLYWQFTFDLGAHYYLKGHTEQYVNMQYDLARMNYELSIRFQPENPQSFYQLGILSMNAGEFEQAISDFETALSQGFEPRWRAINPLVRMLNALGREDEAAIYQAELSPSRQR